MHPNPSTGASPMPNPGALPCRCRSLSENRYVFSLSALRRYLDHPFAIFGHSMGAVLGYEVARRLLAETGHEPYRLFVSGHRAPHLPLLRPPLHRLPDNAFITGVKALNGTPPEVFEHEELLDLILPILRADFELVET